jgi:hypothetical protein
MLLRGDRGFKSIAVSASARIYKWQRAQGISRED